MFRQSDDNAYGKLTNCRPIQESIEVKSECKVATGRSAIFHILGRLPSAEYKTVLLPSYLAEGIIKPFILAGFSVQFYQLELNLSPSIANLEHLLEAIDGRAVVVLIHYFGFPACSGEIRLSLSRFNPIFFDDFAHALFSASPDGEPLFKGSEIALFSLNKFLPVTDGAILLSMRSDIDISLNEEMLLELPLQAQKAYQSHLHAGKQLFEAVDGRHAISALEKIRNNYEIYYSIINADLSPHRQSVSSKKIETSFPYDQLIQSRVNNSRIVYDDLKSDKFTLLHQSLPIGVVPWCVPARVPSELRLEIIENLFKKGILLSTLVDKWNFIPQEKGAHFSVETLFLKEHVLIPVSEFIKPSEMHQMMKAINEI